MAGVLPKDGCFIQEGVQISFKQNPRKDTPDADAEIGVQSVEQIKAVLSSISMDASTDVHCPVCGEADSGDELDDDDLSGVEPPSASKHEKFQDQLQHWGLKLRQSLADIKAVEVQVHKENKELRRVQAEQVKCRERIEAFEQKLKDLKVKRNHRAMKLREAVDELQNAK